MKKTLTISVLALFASCTGQRQEPAATAANEQLVKQYFECFNRHEWAELAGMYAESADFKDPSLGQGIVKQTRQQTTDKYSKLSAIFPDLHDQVVQIYPSGEKHVVVEFVSTGTGPDKAKFELPICAILTIENGVITKDFTYFDNFNEEKGI